MIGPLASSNLASLTSNSAPRVAMETALKSIGRPGFILIDNDIDAQTKKYAATKEFLYQATCLAVYLTIVPKLFQRGAFEAGKRIFSKNHPEFTLFKDYKEYHDYHRFASKPHVSRKADLLYNENHYLKFKHNGVDTQIRKDLLEQYQPNKYPIIKGVIELGTMIGSVLGLAILAPEVGHRTIHPIMKFLGMDRESEAQREFEKNGTIPEPQQVDIKA